MKALPVLLVLVLLAPTPVPAGQRDPLPPPILASEHQHPSGHLTFRTPPGWKVESIPDQPDLIQASGDGLIVRFLSRQGESGYDSLHASCMMERLAGPMETEAHVKYEYDFRGGVVADRRALDSAFAVQYDQPVQGHRVWRQRNVTVVGQGQSLCAISYAPAEVWKKSPAARALLDAVLYSVTLR